MELNDEKRTRIAALLEAAAGSYSVLSRIYFDAAESAHACSDPRALAELEAMAAKFASTVDA